MSSRKKPLPFLFTLASLTAVSGITALAIQLYRRPRETTLGAVHLAMLAGGIREGTCPVRSTSAKTPYIPIHYYWADHNGDPIILIHGLGGSAEGWAALFPRLKGKFQIYALDLPGFGKTPLAPEGTNIHTHVLYLEHFLDALDLPRVILVGNSLGGWIATRFALEHPERIKHLYLLNSAGLRREGMHVPYALDRAAARSSIEHMWGRSLPIAPGFILDAVIQNSRQPAYSGFINAYDSSEELDNVLAEVRVPATIIWGTRDRLLPIACAHDLHTGIPHSELIFLPGVGHMPQIEAAAKVARIISHHSERKHPVSWP